MARRWKITRRGRNTMGVQRETHTYRVDIGTHGEVLAIVERSSLPGTPWVASIVHYPPGQILHRDIAFQRFKDRKAAKRWAGNRAERFDPDRRKTQR